MRTTWRRLLSYLRPYIWPHFVGAIICMVLFSATTGVMPFLVRFIFDDIFSEKDVTMLWSLPFIVIATFIARGFFAFGSTYLSEYVGQRVVADLRSEMNEHIQKLSQSFFDRQATASVVSVVANDVFVIGSSLTTTVAAILRDAVSLVVLIAVAFYQDWFMALIAFVVFPASVLPILNLSRRLRGFARKRQVSLGRLTALLQESVQGNRVVKAFGMEGYEQRRFDEETEHLRALAMRVVAIRAFTSPMMEILAAFGIAGVVLYGGSSVIDGTRTQGAFLAFLTALFLLYDPFKKLGAANATMQQGLAAADRVFEVLDVVSDVRERPDAIDLPEIQREILFDHVGFRYDADLVLRDIVMRIPRGEVVALVGPSGGGKSTLADLILRFYDVVDGAIRIDGVDIRDVTLTSLRSQIALVTQHTFLFNDTVRNNIGYGLPETSDEAIVAAARAAHADEFIRELPNGYETEIGELGLRLSGGQRQRIAIARALLKDAPILVLDEATSALDNESERLVQDALDVLMRGRTTLVIAHRLSTIRSADRIVVLVRGRIVEEGAHEQLLALNAEYRKLYDLQFSNPATAV